MDQSDIWIPKCTDGGGGPPVKEIFLNFKILPSFLTPSLMRRAPGPIGPHVWKKPMHESTSLGGSTQTPSKKKGQNENGS